MISKYPVYFDETCELYDEIAGDQKEVQRANYNRYAHVNLNVVSDKERCFVVSTNNQSQIEVYGTSFNVEAYTSSNEISTTLIEGSIGFIYKDANNQTRKVDLKPNQKLVYEPEMDKVRLYTTSGETETAWKDGKIIFNKTPMKEVLRILGKQFNVEFRVRNKQLDS